MGRASRTRLAATAVVALAALLLGGRLTGRALQRPGDPATAVTAGRAIPRPALVRKLALDHPVDGVVVAGDSGVWIVHGGRLSRVDPWTLRIDAFVVERQPVTAVAAGAGAVWASTGTAAVAAPGVAGRHTRGRTLEEAGGAIRALAAGHDALWVGAPSGLLRVDLRAMP
jgi:hypothetical protein